MAKPTHVERLQFRSGMLWAFGLSWILVRTADPQSFDVVFAIAVALSLAFGVVSLWKCRQQ